VAVAALAAGSLAMILVLDVVANAASAAFVGAVRGNTPAWPYAEIAACACAVPAAALTGALLANVLPAGGFVVRFPVLKFEKLDPRSGVRRMFSREAALAGAKAAAAALALALVLLPVARDALAAGVAGSPRLLGALALGALERSIATALGAGAVFAWIDLVLERSKRRRRLRMSAEELRRDQKHSEGDPLLRSRRRQAHRALAHGSLRRLAEAAFVVANPTHLAIALEYRPPHVAVPRVLVRAAGETARRVRARAQLLGIPVVEDVALARSLFAGSAPGDFIPRAAYGAVAAIVANLLRRNALAP